MEGYLCWGEQVTKQEFYDTTIRHLILQGERSMLQHHTPYCAYRSIGSKGQRVMCAAGVHIQDSEYRPEMEKKNIQAVLVGFGIDGESPLRAFSPLAYQLQQIHDSESHWDEHGLSRKGKAAAREVAVEHDLIPFDFEAVS